MHEATVTVCPVTHVPMRNTRSHPGGVASVRPGHPQQPIVVPRPMGHDAQTPHGPPPRSARRSLIGQVVDGKYKVRAVLGEGGMGAVFEAEHTAIGRIVAMKVLHPAQAGKKVAVKRFHQEARAAGGIGHPNICEVFDFGTLPDGSPYLVMERLKGETLASRIATDGGLPFLEVVETVIQVLSGLAAAHERGILHRDIKPENVFLAERVGYSAIVKLLDFGVSKVVPGQAAGEWEDDTDLTKTGMVMGTPYYMSPEQARGDRNLDGRVDLYACGVMLYESLTGQRPFVAKNYNSLLVQILQGGAAPPRSIRASILVALEAVVFKAMARNRDDRYKTAAEFARALVPIRKELTKASSGRVASARMVAHTPGLSQSSADIPIHFADSDALEPAASSDEWDQTTAPMLEVPSSDDLPEPASPYDDAPGQHDTIRVDPNSFQRPPPPPARRPQKEKEDADEPTDRMNQADIQHIVDAVREARERDRRRGRG
jgi:serine/threonine-protein kinase